MTSDMLKRVLTASPFQPFRIHMGGGRSIDVRHPEFAWMNPSGRIAVVSVPGEESVEIIDVFMIQSIEVTGKGRGRNGKRGRAA